MPKTLGQIAFEAEDQYWSQGLKYHVPPRFEDLTEDARQVYERVAAAVAAQVRRDMRWRPIAEAPADEWLMAGKWHDTRAVWCREWQVFKDEAIMSNYTHYLPQPEPPEKENT